MRRQVRLGANATLSPSGAEVDAVLIAKLGGKIMRTSQEQPWGSVLARLGPFARAAADHGLELFQTCQATGHVVPRTQAGLDAFGEYVAECTTYSPRVSTGNEVNGFGSNETPDPHGQAEMLLAAAAAVAKLNPGAKLATPSLCPASGALGARYVEPLVFFDAMVASEPSILRIPRLEVDWHGYGPFGQPITTPATWNTAERTLALGQDLAKLGHATMPIAWSEFGEPTGSNVGVSLAQQVIQFDGYMTVVGQLHAAGIHVGELIWYALRDRTPANVYDWPAWCGLVDVHGTPKPVAQHFTMAAKAAA